MDISELLALLPPALRNRARQGGEYSLTWTGTQALGASASSAPATFTTGDESVFLALRMVAYATDNNNPPAELTAPQATLLLTAGTLPLFRDNVPVHIGGFNANATKSGGMDLPFPFVITKNTTVTGTLTNLTATAMQVRVSLYGLAILNYDRAPGYSGL